MLKKLCFLILSFFLFSCIDDSAKEAEIENIQVDFDVIRFDQKFANTSPENLDSLKSEYPFLFPSKFPDSIWVNKLRDTIQEEIEVEVEKAFPEFSEHTEELFSLFQHVKYYFPQFQVPDVITVTSEVDYKNKVIYTGEYLFISLDTYLGKDHKFYIGIQEFLKKNFREEQIVSDVAGEIARKYVPKPESRSFLDHMIYYGKTLYLKDVFIPSEDDTEKIGYTMEELNWAKANEDQIWRYFVENEIIFDTDAELYTRFLYPAPFSKFYLQLDAESPDRLGQYIGWNIVRTYMDKNDLSVNEMLNKSAEEIFNKANYKPKK